MAQDYTQNPVQVSEKNNNNNRIIIMVIIVTVGPKKYGHTNIHIFNPWRRPKTTESQVAYQPKSKVLL